MKRERGRLGALVATGAALALSGTAEAATATVSCNSDKADTSCGGSAGKLHASIVPSTHSPKVNAKWPLSVKATTGGKPAHASAVYQFLFGGTVVSTQYPRSNKHFTFNGAFSDILVFPPDSDGEPLTLRVVIRSAGETVNLEWSIKSVE
jgi:hypothetical protein